MKEQKVTGIVINPEDTTKTTDRDLWDWITVYKSEALLTDEDTKLNNLLIANADNIPQENHDKKIAHLREEVLELQEKQRKSCSKPRLYVKLVMHLQAMRMRKKRHSFAEMHSSSI